MTPNIALLFAICDGDKKHFNRFYNELMRLNFPYAIHFDHCCQETKDRFRKTELCIGISEDDDPKSFFDESYRQFALNIIIAKYQYTHFMHLDVDETLERDARQKILSAASTDVDIVVFPCLDLWGDGKHYRKDGPFQGGQREKVFKITGNNLRYYHPTIHAPKVTHASNPFEDIKVVKLPIHILHWGIMNLEDAAFHKERWDVIYTRKVGANPYKGYDYYFDPTTVPLIVEVPEDML